MSALGAIVMYIVSMLSSFALRKNEPKLERPFPAIAYPLFPAIALVLALVSLLAMIYFNTLITAIFLVLLGASFAYFSSTGHHRAAADDGLAAETV